MTYIKEIHKLRKKYSKDRQLVWFDVPMLSSPEWMNPKILPEMVSVLEESIKYMESNKETYLNKFKGFKDFEISKVQRLVDWIKSADGYDKEKHMNNFYLYFSEQDRRNGTDILKTFPELDNFWKECKDKNGR
jgi:hypothetical protein